MNWLTNFVRPKISALKGKSNTKENLWKKCDSCSQMIFHRELIEKLYVCSNCGNHLHFPIKDRLEHLFDNKIFDEVDLPEFQDDLLKFRDKIKYSDRLKNARIKADRKDAIIVAKGTIGKNKTVVALMDFKFMGGSMGMAVGEGIVEAAKLAKIEKRSLLIIASSGGARMQEGIISLMQMPRTIAAIEEYKEIGLPYIVLFTNPTTGGVSASFAMLGDVLIAEPGALIGFAGPRVIENTVKEKLPEGFQRSEYLSKTGMLDIIEERKKIPKTIGIIIKHLSYYNK